MKLWKSITVGVVFGVCIGSICGCVDQAEPAVARRMNVSDSIYTKNFDQNYPTRSSFRLYIVKVDNREYIVNSRGGIVEHTK